MNKEILELEPRTMWRHFADLNAVPRASKNEQRVIAFMKDFGNRLGLEKPLGSIDRTKLNVNGSSLAVGHPFAATGARIVATLAQLLEQKGSGRGLISVCTAGGMGVSAILERP